jgi:hypothetical protein
MQAYKLQGKIDSSGKLIISEAIDLPAGDVEIILLQSVLAQKPETPRPQLSQEQSKYRIEALKDLLKNAPPVPPDFDADQAKWEYLKEKHSL